MQLFFLCSIGTVPHALPHPVSGLESVHVTRAAGSGVASFAVGKDGSLWAWGRSQRGQLGLGSKIVDSPLPQRVTALENENIVEVRLSET
jgi:alpha-tubulin suppressor-like RCC1 family protein